MLSIGVMASGQGAYYIGLAREDYYMDGGEPPGVWHGQGAAALGLVGKVDGGQLTRLFEGFHPRDPQALVEIQEGKGHRPGWDLTFSAPKSVSVLWSQASEETRNRIQNAHFNAVKAALDYLESSCAVARRGTGGEHQEKGSLIFATFEHGTSRAQDPQLHTHALFMNAVLREDGTFGTVNAESVFKSKMVAGALYRAELAKELEQQLGTRIERRENTFEVEGVSNSLCDEFSKRRAEIEKVLAEKGMDSAEAAAVAALSTRSAKADVSREELFASWRSVGKAHGWSQADAHSLLGRSQKREPVLETAQALEETTKKVTEQQSYFSERDFTRRLAEAAVERGLGASQVISATREHLTTNPEIISLGRLYGQALYTTREMMELEGRVFEAVEQSKKAPDSGVKEETLKHVIATSKQLSDEQESALRHITQEKGGSIRVVSGMAGTGKTTLLREARRAWEREGFEVRGASLSGKATKGLEEGAGIKSETIHKTLLELKDKKIEFSERTVLVIDEAGMAGTRQMAALTEATQKAGAKLVLVGDARQLQPIEAGGVFPEIEKRLGAAELTDIRRQREEWSRKAVHDFADGRAKEGLKAYAERGFVHIAENEQAARADLINAWKVGGVRAPEDQLIFTGTRKDATILNRMAQSEREKAGMLSEESVSVGGDRFHVGDRVLFTQKSKRIGVVNGTLGEVTGVNSLASLLEVRLDDGEIAQFSAWKYDHIKLGYAMTSHKGQGATVENAFILAGGAMQDREITYVQASRARGDTHIFADRETAGDELGQLVRQMSESRAKETAHAVAKRAEANLGIKAHRLSQRQGMSF